MSERAGRCFEDVAVGDTLGPLIVMPSRESLVRYAAAASDFARLHYDEPYARSRGFPTVIVHGLLKAGYLGRLLTEWTGPEGWVRRFATEYRRSDFPDRPLFCRGRVVALSPGPNGGDVELEIWTENDSHETTVTGRATVRLPSWATRPAKRQAAP